MSRTKKLGAGLSAALAIGLLATFAVPANAATGTINSGACTANIAGEPLINQAWTASNGKCGSQEVRHYWYAGGSSYGWTIWVPKTAGNNTSITPRKANIMQSQHKHPGGTARLYH